MSYNMQGGTTMKIRFPTFITKIPYDKKLHFLAGLLIALVVSITVNPTCALIVSMVAGLAKEIKDYLDYGGPDVVDCLATWLGGGVGYAVAMMM
jgi:hypothetical protein